MNTKHTTEHLKGDSDKSDVLVIASILLVLKTKNKYLEHNQNASFCAYGIKKKNHSL